MKRSVDPELLLDLIFGPIYFRLLVKHHPLNHAPRVVFEEVS
jgi:hypothetical protein